jgi:hypothetical protein
MQHLRRRFTKAGVAVVTILATLVLLVGVALAITVDWEGNGADDGFCNNVSEDAGVPPNTQQWHFILTSPDPGPWTLTANFADSGQQTDGGTQAGMGAVHFFVFSSIGDQLLTASATNGSDNSVLTVSDCKTGPVVTTTTSTTSTSTTSTTSTTTTTAATTTTTAPTTTTVPKATTTTAPPTTAPKKVPPTTSPTQRVPAPAVVVVSGARFTG